MGVPTSEVGYTTAMPRREDHEVHKDYKKRERDRVRERRRRRKRKKEKSVIVARPPCCYYCL
jgi:hypothetical protein